MNVASPLRVGIGLGLAALFAGVTFASLGSPTRVAVVELQHDRPLLAQSQTRPAARDEIRELIGFDTEAIRLGAEQEADESCRKISSIRDERRFEDRFLSDEMLELLECSGPVVER